MIRELHQKGFDLWVGTEAQRLEVSRLEVTARAVVEEQSQERAQILLLEEEKVRGSSSDFKTTFL